MMVKPSQSNNSHSVVADLSPPSDVCDLHSQVGVWDDTLLSILNVKPETLLHL